MKTLAAIALALMLSTSVQAQAPKTPAPKETAKPAVMPPDTTPAVQTANPAVDTWMAQFNQWREISDTINFMIHENGIDKLEEQQQKLQQKLGNSIPPGFQFDRTQMKLVPVSAKAEDKTPKDISKSVPAPTPAPKK